MKISNSSIIQAVVWLSIIAIAAYAGNAVDKPYEYYFIILFRVFTLAMYFNVLYHGLLPLYFNGKKRAFFVFLPLVFSGYVVFVALTDAFFWTYKKEKFLNKEEVEFHNHSKPWSKKLLPPIFLGLVVLGLASSLRGFSAYEKKKKDAEEANRRRLEAELALLKSQINPHFLLNTLNNLYSIALTEPEKTPDALLKLSEMVKYILYDCQQSKISLTKDLAFIQNYIDLQRMRLAENMQIQYHSEIGNGEIEPMILIPFIENAFKHGLTAKKPCEINISIKIEPDKLMLLVENEIYSSKTNEIGQISGIGLENTKQRLEHSYPNKHFLTIEKEGDFHKVSLVLLF
jgi:two-component system, LytTR family, sensor kinase